MDEIPDPSDGEADTLRQEPDCTIPDGSETNGGCNYEVDGLQKPAFYRHCLPVRGLKPQPSRRTDHPLLTHSCSTSGQTCCTRR